MYASGQPSMMFHVKHSDHIDSVKLQLAAGLLGFHPSELMLEQLELHIDLLLEANQRVNLTAVREKPAALRLHALDSLGIISAIVEAPEGVVADLGSGGGFPGIPVALCTDRSVVLVESVKKKAAFLESVIEELGLADRVTVSPLRAEEEALRSPSRYSVVVSRALSSLPSLLELSAPLLEKHGWMIAMKGRLESHEIASGRTAGQLVGMDEVAVRRYELPGGEELRALAIYQNSGHPQMRLPRNTGMAQKKPLA